MKIIVVVILSVLFLASCNKRKGFSDYDIEVVVTSLQETLDFNANVYKDTNLIAAPYSEALQGHKIIQLISAADVDSLMVYGIYELIGDETISERFGDIDFNVNSIFVFQLNYSSQGQSELKRRDLLINHETKEILFEYKLKAHVGGSGMLHWNQLFFMIIPVEHSNYTVKGTYEVIERGFGGGTDHMNTYSQ